MERMGCEKIFGVFVGALVALLVGAVVASCTSKVLADGPAVVGCEYGPESRCTLVECRLRSGCWPREPDAGGYHWDAMVFSLERGEMGCAGRSKTLVLRDRRGRRYELTLMELTDRHDDYGGQLWYRFSDFRATGLP